MIGELEPNWKERAETAERACAEMSKTVLHAATETDKARKACAEMRAALEAWKAYCQSNIPTNADEQEVQGEQFTHCWFDAEHALSSDAGRDYFHRDEVKPLVDALRGCMNALEEWGPGPRDAFVLIQSQRALAAVARKD